MAAFSQAAARAIQRLSSAKRSDAGQTALHLSAATGQPKLTKFLLERGADPTVKDAEGRTPLSYAVQNKHPQTASVLRQSLPKP